MNYLDCISPHGKRKNLSVIHTQKPGTGPKYNVLFIFINNYAK